MKMKIVGISVAVKSLRLVFREMRNAIFGSTSVLRQSEIKGPNYS